MKKIAFMLCFVMLLCSVLVSCDKNQGTTGSSETTKVLQSSESTAETSAQASEETTAGSDTPNQDGAHVHNYNVKNTDEKYLKSEAFYDIRNAVYYYSCECGEKGTDTDTFEKDSDWVSISKTVYCIKRPATIYDEAINQTNDYFVNMTYPFVVVATDGKTYKCKKDDQSNKYEYISVEDTTDSYSMVLFTDVNNSLLELEDYNAKLTLYSDLGLTKAFDVEGVVAMGVYPDSGTLRVIGFNQTRDFLKVTYQGYDTEYNLHAFETYYCYAKGTTIWYDGDDLKFN